MGRRKKTDRERLAELLGIEPPPPVRKHERETSSREAEAVLIHHVDARHFVESVCKGCKLPFMHTRACIAYCSDACRAVALSKIGIIWNPDRKPEDRWGITEPLVIGVEATALLKSLPTAEEGAEGQPEPEPVLGTDLPDDVLDILREVGLS